MKHNILLFSIFLLRRNSYTASNHGVMNQSNWSCIPLTQGWIFMPLYKVVVDYFFFPIPFIICKYFTLAITTERFLIIKPHQLDVA